MGITIQHEKPQLEVQKTELLRKEEELKVQLAELEESLLEVETTKTYNTYFKKFKIEIKIKSSLSSITQRVVTQSPEPETRWYYAFNENM